MKVTRHQIMYGSLAMTIALVIHTAWFNSDENDNTAVPNRITKPRNDVSMTLGANGDDNAPKRPMKFGRDPLIEANVDPFVVVNFIPPPPAATTLAAPPPPKPSAPPFPYRFFGSMTDIDGTKTSYLQRGDELIAIHAKQVLDHDYRVDSISAQQVVVEYRPLEEKTVLNIQTAENN